MRYRDFYDAFRWELPSHFNFAVDVVDRWADERDGPALIWENAAGDRARYSYSDIARLSRRFAAVLREHGVAKGDRVLIMLPRLPHWQIAMAGALRIGAVPIPCIEMLTARDLAYRMTHAGARAVVCRTAQVGKFDGIAGDVPARIALGGAPGWVDWEEALAAAPELEDAVLVAAEDPAVMYYTSGSTGEPKGVLHCARALYAWRVSAQYWLDLKPEDRIWCTADTGWSKAGTSILFGPWSCGACSFFYDGDFDPAVRLRLLERHRITVYCAPGTELYRIVNEDVAGYDLSALRRTVSAGEAMNPVVAEKWREQTGITVSEAYGQTEALMLVLNFPNEPVKFGSMGLPSPGSDVDVIDGDGRRLGLDQEGDIAVRVPNPQMMLGYWQEAERTKACFVDGPDGRWFVTGDRATRDADGYFWYRGRADDVISSAGYRIGPLEVENALLEHPAVQECAVVGSPHPERGEIVKAFVVLRAGASADDALARALQEHVKAITAPYKYPRVIEFLGELPKTLTGKIRRRALRDLEHQRVKAGSDEAL
ncbi:MAG: AMP-binding protein [Alphaproteobacteria bacterium]|nr:AMP-binding protein [Alphaproteobacteria bacterium]